MTDMSKHNDDKRVPPLRAAKPRRSFIRSDRMLTIAGVALAAGAAAFPWYVFFNEDKFGINVAAIDHTRDLPEGLGRNVFSVSPMAEIGRASCRERV